ncbi:MAG: hypothetical protein LBL07_05705 [Tannerella sp.]|jgi:hypothetical protein|nr:hypothetical protein [Tannerella sp.]
MNVLAFVKEGKRWVSDVFQPARVNIEVAVRFKDEGGGFVGVLRSVDGVEFTPFESGVTGNLGRNTRLLIFNVTGIVPGGFLRLVSTSEPDADSGWRED